MEDKTYKSFKDKYVLSDRIKELEKLKSRYPNMISVIIEINKNTKTLKMLEK